MNDTTKQTEEVINYMPEDTMLSDMARQSITNFYRSGNMQKTMDTAMNRMLKDIFESAITGYSSDFKKAVEKYFKESLKFDPGQTDLAEYQYYIQDALVKELKGVQGTFTDEMIKKAVSTVIGIDGIKDKYTLEEFISKVITSQHTVSDGETDFDGETRTMPITFHSDISPSLCFFYFDTELERESRYSTTSSEKKGLEKYRCSYKLVVYGDNNKEKSGKIHSVTVSLGDDDSGVAFMLNAKFKGVIVTHLDDCNSNSRDILNLDVTDNYED